MLPIVLNRASHRIGLCGEGDGLDRRAGLLARANIEPISVAPDGKPDDLAGLSVLFVVGLDRALSARLAAAARALGVLVNVEDIPELCDFHVPAIVRRGDLTVSISTAGKAPGLSRLIREWIERKLGLEWGRHLDELAQERVAMRAAGNAPQDVSRGLRRLVEERELLP